MRLQAALAAVAILWAAGAIGGQTAPAGSPAERPAASLPAGLAPSAVERVDAYGDPLPPGAIARLGTVRLRQLNPAFSVAFSPDGNSFATGQGDGHICIWDRSTGRLLRRLAGHNRTVHSLLYVEGGRTLLSGGADATLRWWDANAGTERHKAEAAGAVTALVLGMDGKRVLAASARNLQVYDIAGGARLDEIRLSPAARPGEAPPISSIGASLAVIPRDDRVVLGGQDGNIHFLHLPSRKETSAIPVGVKAQIALAVGPDGRTLAWGDAGGRIRTMDLGTGAELKGLVGHTDHVHDLAFSPDGRLIVSRSGDGTVRLWDLAGKELWQVDSCGNLPNSLAFSPDGRCLAVARVDKTVDLLDVATGKRLFDFPGQTEQVYGLAVSPDGTRLASSAVSSGGKVRDAIQVWDLAAMKLIWRGPQQAGPGARCVAWRPDGNALASCGSSEKKARLWDAAAGRELATLPDQQALVTCLAFQPEAGTVLFGQRAGLGAWDPATGKVEERPEAGTAYVYSLAVSRDGGRVAVGGASTVQVLDANKAGPTRTLTDTRGVYWSLRFTPDGAQLVGAGATGVSLWDLDTGGLAASVKTSPKSLWCADLSPDGRLLAAAAGDGNILLLETATCETLAALAGHQGPAYSVAFLDARRLASAGADTQVLIWSLDEVFGLPPAAPTEEGLLAAWEALSGEAGAAFRAQRAMAAAGPKALALIRERLRPPPPPDANRIRRLIVELDSDRFAVREAATAALRKIGRDALPFLQNALRETASAEVRQRAGQLVEAMTEPQPPSPQEKQALRAIAVLEAVGGGEARTLLRSLAESNAPPLILRHARAALARLRPAP